MAKEKKCSVTVLCRSCLTGQVVWVYRGPTEGAAKQAYRRTRQREKERLKRWSEIVQRRTSNITRLMNECLAALPINAELTEVQKNAVKKLKKISRSLCDSPVQIMDKKIRFESLI